MLESAENKFMTSAYFQKIFLKEIFQPKFCYIWKNQYWESSTKL